MKFGAKDLKQLRLPLATCLVLAIAGAGGYVAAKDHLQKMRTATAAQRTEIQTKLASATEEEREIKANLQQYQSLAARGIVGEEKRLDWVDTLTAIKNERRLFNISYSIEPQKNLDYPGFTPGVGVKFVYSRVAIEMPLLHEEDLLNFIDDLTKRSKAYLSARNCDVHRAERGSGGTSLAPRLLAKCSFDLITINHDKPA
jgi:hypothetical protein